MSDTPASPLSFAAIGVVSIEASLDFYCDLIGFDVVAEGESTGDVTAMLGLSPDVRMRTALLSAAGCPVGRILLFEMEGAAGARIRQPGDRTTRGFWNVNFYVEDIRATGRDLAARGFEIWHPPVEYDVGGGAGQVVEMVFDGPDGVAVNLVQPIGAPDTATGRVRLEAEAAGRTRTGFTPVATSPICVTSAERTLPFYQALFGSEVLIDARMGRDETNLFLCRPKGAISHTIFIGGGHPFGKVAINQPLNYAVPERVAATVPGNIGYFAQGFRVPDLAQAVERAVAAGGEAFAVAGRMGLAGFGEEPAILVRTPDRGPPVWLVEGAPGR